MAECSTTYIERKGGEVDKLLWLRDVGRACYMGGKEGGMLVAKTGQRDGHLGDGVVPGKGGQLICGCA